MYEVFLRLLKRDNVKPNDVAKVTGIPPSTFTDWKSGKSSPKLEKLQKIAEYFNVSMDYLLTGEEITEKWVSKYVDPQGYLAELQKNPSLRKLIDEAKGMDEKKIDFLIKMIGQMKD